jgi:hypothetical protein
VVAPGKEYRRSLGSLSLISISISSYLAPIIVSVGIDVDGMKQDAIEVDLETGRDSNGKGWEGEGRTR